MKLARWLSAAATFLLFLVSHLPAQTTLELVGNCGEAIGLPGGCSDPICESCVCAIDPSCCGEGLFSFGWDSVCVSIAASPAQCLGSCEAEASDSDNDGVSDDADVCPTSDVSLTVVIDGCDSGVDNTTTAEGCTLSDEIATCADEVNNHGAYVRCVSHFTNDLKANDELTGEEKDALQSCAGQADIP